MENYDDYYAPFSDKLISGGKKLFQLHTSGIEGRLGTVDGIETNLIIQQHTNPLNQGTDENKLMCESDVNIKMGSIVIAKDINKIDNITYIVTSEVDDNSITKKCLIRKSTITLNYYKNNILFSVPAIVYTGTESLEENKYMFLPADELLLKCQNNIDTSYIKEGTRFLLSGTAYKVITINNILEQGLLRIRIKEDSIDMTDDNLTLSIANYYSNQNTYTLSLLSNSTLNLNTSSETSQINIKAYKNNVLVSSPVVTYVSSALTKASVSSTGLITCHAIGVATITVTYQLQTVTVTVTGVTSSEHSYKINITGLDTIKVGREETYSGLFLDEGVVSANTFTWLLTATDGITSTDLATILSSTSTSCILKTNLIPKYGEIKLKCTTTDTNYTTTKTIKIISTI